MGLIDDLLEAAGAEPEVVVRQVVEGPRFTGVGVSLPGSEAIVCAGVAFRSEAPADLADAGTAGSGAEQEIGGAALTWAKGLAGQPGASREHGAAALNAIFAHGQLARGTAPAGENGLDAVAREGTGKRLAIVGRFPHLEEIRRAAVQSWVLELEPEGDELPAHAAADVLPKADVVGITGSTLANGTLERLLRLCRRDAFVALIGPTTPLSPVLFDYGVRALFGVVPEDAAQALASIQQEGSTRRIPGMRSVCLRR